MSISRREFLTTTGVAAASSAFVGVEGAEAASSPGVAVTEVPDEVKNPFTPVRNSCAARTLAEAHLAMMRDTWSKNPEVKFTIGLRGDRRSLDKIIAELTPEERAKVYFEGIDLPIPSVTKEAVVKKVRTSPPLKVFNNFQDLAVFYNSTHRVV